MATFERADGIPTVEEIRNQAELLATPLDFEQLVADGILRKRGAWWEVLDMDRLPKHARCKISWIKTGGLVKFSKPSSKLLDWMNRTRRGRGA
jgi:hypothetical protein